MPQLKNNKTELSIGTSQDKPHAIGGKHNTANHICCIYNSGPHYRWPIFKALADNFDIDFCFGANTVYTNTIETFDYNKLQGFCRLLKNRRLAGKFYWQSGALRQVFKPYKTYLMLGEAYCVSSWLIVMLARLTGKKTICWTHGWYGRESKLKRIVSKCFYSMFNQILTYNDYAGNLLAEGGINRKKIHTVGNSLDSAKHREIRKRLKQTDIYTTHFGNNDPVLLYCGRIQKLKRLEMLIECATRLIEEGQSVNLVFVGHDGENVGLQELAAKANISDKVWFYGACYDEEKLAELFHNATLCVSPGNVGLTAIHSLSFGCPIVTHDNFSFQMPEFESICPGKTGDFFIQNDIESLVKVVKRWLNRPPEQCQATAQAAYSEIDAKWNVESQIETFKKIF